MWLHRASRTKFALILFKIHRRYPCDQVETPIMVCRFGSAQRPKSLPMTQPDFLTITHSKDFTLVVSAPLDDFRASLKLRSQSLRRWAESKRHPAGSDSSVESKEVCAPCKNPGRWAESKRQSAGTVRLLCHWLAWSHIPSRTKLALILFKIH